MSKTVAMMIVVILLIASGLYFSNDSKMTGFAIYQNNDTNTIEPASNQTHEDERFYSLPTCSDDTPFNSCSLNQSLYCDFGNLVEKCTECGCDPDKGFCNNITGSLTYNRCIKSNCLVDSDCNDYDANTKDTCLNPYKILSNGSSGSECSYQLQAKGIIDVAIVELEQPDLTYGQTIHFCSDDKGCFVVQEAAWNNMKNSYCGSDLNLCNYTAQFDYKYVMNYKYDDIDFKYDYDCIVDDEGNSGKCIYNSLKSLEKWFSAESDKHDASFGVRIKTFGPYETSSVPPKRTDSENCDKLDPYFESQNLNLDLSDYDIVVYLYMTDSATGNIFQSCNTTNAYVSYSRVDLGILSTKNLNDLITNVAAEIIHRLGATGDVIGVNGVDLEDYVITSEAAKEIGWK
ncbi:MAG: hypothetical protein PHU12_00485 [Candidatus Aenigmarchaeota archaeon]|nr:hypothetical protein [Candidatus Aenigmarchaeota archaeon]